MVGEDDGSGDGGGGGRGGGGRGCGVFSGVKYRLLGFDAPALEQQYKMDLETRGANLATRMIMTKENCTHLVVNSETIRYENPFCVKARENDVAVVNEYWIIDSVSRGTVADAKKVMYRPLKELQGIPGCLQLHICSSGYPQDRCLELGRMTEMMGASFYEKLTEKATHLICYKFGGSDYEFAKKCKADVINHQWIEDCLKEWRILPVKNYTMSDLELKEARAKAGNQELVFQKTVPSHNLPLGNSDVSAPRKKPTKVFSLDRESEGTCIDGNISNPVIEKKSLSKHFCTPQTKAQSINTNRKSFSTGAKRSKGPTEHESTMKCKRALNYDSGGETEVTMVSYARNGLTRSVEIPYSSDREMAKEGIKMILLNAYDLLVNLHQEGKTLKGKFGSKNFIISLHNKKVKLYGIEPLLYCKGDAKIDKQQFVSMVKDVFGKRIPAEVLGWLDRMETNAPNNVLRRHVNMLHADDAFGEFCAMFHKLLQLKDLDEEGYNDVLEDLKSYDGWRKRTFNWCVLEKNHTERGNEYEDNAFGLVKLIRNTWAHPAKLYHEVLIAVLMGEYPDLLSDVQFALYSNGHLAKLDRKNID